jgi:hypothetical protein
MEEVSLDHVPALTDSLLYTPVLPEYLGHYAYHLRRTALTPCYLSSPDHHDIGLRGQVHESDPGFVHRRLCRLVCGSRRPALLHSKYLKKHHHWRPPVARPRNWVDHPE